MRIRGINPVFLVEDDRLRVRIPALEERIAARMRHLIRLAPLGDVLPQGLPVPADLEGMVAAVLEIGFPGVAGALEAIDQQELGLRVQGDGQGIEQTAGVASVHQFTGLMATVLPLLTKLACSGESTEL